MDTRKTAKKRNFSDVEIETITREVEKNKIVLFGSLKSGIKGAHKNKIWNQITSSVNSVGVEKRTPAEVKKKWSDIKIATKRRVSALKRSQSQTGGGPPDPSLQLTPNDERVAALIGTVSLEGITGGGDTDDIHDDGTAGPSALEASPPQPIQEPEPILAPHPEPEQVQAGEAEARPPASRAPRPRVLTDEVLERQTEIC
ncbi:hypothetical protein PO909_003891 [Leuciscus waleckii]